MSKGHTLQDPYLNILRKERVPFQFIWLMVSSCRGRLSLLISLLYCLKTPSARWSTSMRFPLLFLPVWSAYRCSIRRKKAKKPVKCFFVGCLKGLRRRLILT